jgi:hypothetical protein
LCEDTLKISIKNMDVLVQRPEQQVSAGQTVTVFQKELEQAAGGIRPANVARPGLASVARPGNSKIG